MEHRLPRIGLIFLVLTFAFAIALTGWLLPRLGGPSLKVSDQYEVTAQLDDLQALETKAVVLVRGVEVGTVRKISVADDKARVTLEIHKKFVPIYRDASVRIGQRTAIGDAYVALDRGTPGAGALASGAAIAKVEPTVEFDEAFNTFDPVTREHAAALTRTFGTGATDARTADRWNATVKNLSAAVHELNGVTTTLRGQEPVISSLVSNSTVALAQLGQRDRQLQSLVDNGGRTLRAFADHPVTFDRTLRHIAPFMRQARVTLGEIEPLLREGRPVLDDLRVASPALRKAFSALRPASRDLDTALDRFAAFNRIAVPVLKQADGVMKVARPLAANLLPVTANLVPVAQFLHEHEREFASWFSFTRAFGQHGDSKSKWARFIIFMDPLVAAGVKGSVERNAYPRPGDQANNAPYTPGSYQRLMPYAPGKGSRGK